MVMWTLEEVEECLANGDIYDVWHDEDSADELGVHITKLWERDAKRMEQAANRACQLEERHSGYFDVLHTGEEISPLHPHASKELLDLCEYLADMVYYEANAYFKVTKSESSAKEAQPKRIRRIPPFVTDIGMFHCTKPTEWKTMEKS